MKKRKLVDSSTPFTDWVRNGAKEEEWQRFLRDQERKEAREARKTHDKLLMHACTCIKEKGIELEELLRDISPRTFVHAFMSPLLYATGQRQTGSL